MKKFKFSTICCTACSLSLLLASPLLAGLITTVQGSVPDAGTGPGLEIKLSPNVSLGYLLEADGASFAINSENTSIAHDATAGAIQNRNEYGIASDYSGYYMRPVIAAAIVAPLTDDSATFNVTANGWTKM